MKSERDRFNDKATWGPGPWQDEPDRDEWVDPGTGLPCLVLRNRWVTGALCGYVGVPPGHPDWGKGYDDIPAHAHGGLTYSGPAQDHIQFLAPGHDDHWIVGFDCSHLGDLSPRMEATMRQWGGTGFTGETYRTLEYVKAQCTELAAQLAARVTDEGDDEQPGT